ncbi:hypothetical protein MYX84_13155 [Acidobacteria bacterium AH-259-O06]|nr:hypothetical protein [Acidobacteria bacterium AH-259-O06]
MSFRNWFGPPRHLLVLFLAITFVPATALLWLSWRILEQDRALETQRIQERLEHAADLIAAALERRLAEIEQQLPAWAASPPAGWGEDARIVELTPPQYRCPPQFALSTHCFTNERACKQPADRR